MPTPPEFPPLRLKLEGVVGILAEGVGLRGSEIVGFGVGRFEV